MPAVTGISIRSTSDGANGTDPRIAMTFVSASHSGPSRGIGVMPVSGSSAPMSSAPVAPERRWSARRNRCASASAPTVAFATTMSSTPISVASACHPDRGAVVAVGEARGDVETGEPNPTGAIRTAGADEVDAVQQQFGQTQMHDPAVEVGLERESVRVNVLPRPAVLVALRRHLRGAAATRGRSGRTIAVGEPHAVEVAAHRPLEPVEVVVVGGDAVTKMLITNSDPTRTSAPADSESDEVEDVGADALTTDLLWLVRRPGRMRVGVIQTKVGDQLLEARARVTRGLLEGECAVIAGAQDVDQRPELRGVLRVPEPVVAQPLAELVATRPRSTPGQRRHRSRRPLLRRHRRHHR